MTHAHHESLRPRERRVLDMHSEGVAIGEIATRIKRSSAYVERLIDWTKIPRTGSKVQRNLTPVERRVLDMRADGESREEIAAKFKRTERYIRQVEGLAHFKEGQRLLTGN